MKRFRFTLFLFLALLCFNVYGQDYPTAVIGNVDGEADIMIIGGEKWPADGDSYGWVLVGANDANELIYDRKDTYLVNFSYYRGFALRETGVVKVSTDAFLYDLPQGTADDRLMNDVLVALLKQGLRVDVTRRGEWIQVGPWAKLIPPGLIYDSRSLPQRPKS